MAQQKNITYCRNCGNPTDYKKSHNKNRLSCSKKCAKDYHYKQYISSWKEGKVDGVQSTIGTSEHIRRYLYEKYNGKCARCSWAEVNPITGKIPLQIEHINGDFLDNTEENLILLCPNCHSLTPTFGALNKGRGRYNYKKMFENNFAITVRDIPKMFHYDVEAGWTHPSEHDFELALDLNNPNREKNIEAIYQYFYNGRSLTVGDMVWVLGRIKRELTASFLPDLVEKAIMLYDNIIREGACNAIENIPNLDRVRILKKFMKLEYYKTLPSYERNYIEQLLADAEK